MSAGAFPSFSAMATFPGGFAGGLVVQGMPVLNAYPGRVFWLDSRNGADGNKGTFGRPFASLAGALAQMMAPPPTVWADLLMVKAGHRETISSATALNLTVSGVQIIGLGSGNNRPHFTLDTATNTTINVMASDVTIQNIVFLANYANIASLFTQVGASVTASMSGTTMTVTAVGSGTLYAGQSLHSATSGFITGTKIVTQLTGTAGGVGTYQISDSQTVASGTVTTVARHFKMVDCEVRDNSSVLNFVTVFTTSNVSNACDGLTIATSKFVLQATSGAVNLLTAAGTNDRVALVGNSYSAKTTNAGAVIPIATGKVITNLDMGWNRFDLVNASGTTTGILITTDGSTNSGMIYNNYAQALDATTEILVTASSGFRFFENYYSAATDASGYLRPAADS